MAGKYTAEALESMTDKELRGEKAYLEEMLFIWGYQAMPFTSSIGGYRELGNERMARIYQRSYKKLLRRIRAVERALDLINEEQCKRGAL